MNVPSEADCLALLEKFLTPAHIIRHCQRVWDVGKILGEGLVRQAYPVDIPLLRASCLLHDIGKFPCIQEGRGYHDVRGQEILEQEGLPAVGSIVVQHVVLRGTREDPIAEQHLVFYADKRVVHDQVVTIDERFEYLRETYGKFPEAVTGLMAMKEQTLRLEREIFRLLDFGPEEILRLVEAPWD